MKITKYKTLDKSIKNKFDVCISTYKSILQTETPEKIIEHRDEFLQWISNVPKKHFVRIYTDKMTLNRPEFESIKNIVQDNVEIFLFEYPEYINDRGEHDEDLIKMTLYLPLFDKSLEKDYNIKYIWLFPPMSFPSYLSKDNIKKMKSRKADVFYYSKGCFSRPWVPDDLEYPILTNRIIVKSNVSVSKYKFDKFLKDVLAGKYEDLKKLSINFHEYTKTYKLNPDSKYFIRGFDEYYANNILVQELMKYKTVVCLQLSLLPFRRYKRLDIDLPNNEAMDDLEYKILLETPDLKQNMIDYKALSDIAYDYLSKKDTTQFPYRMKMCYNFYGKYRNKIDFESDEFGVYLTL
jgi:hypothetical protein